MSKIHLAPPNQILGTGVQTFKSGFVQKSEAIRTGKGMLYSGYFYNKNVADRYVWIFDSLTATGTTLVPPIKVPASNGLSLDERYGIPFKTGLSIALSTTDGTYTAASTDLDMLIGYTTDQTTGLPTG